MEFNRNHYFLAGLVFLMLGIQFRLVESFELNDHASEWVTSTFGGEKIAAMSPRQYLPAAGPAPHRVWHPPQWLGWALISVGAVLTLQSLAMPKPSG